MPAGKNAAHRSAATTTTTAAAGPDGVPGAPVAATDAAEAATAAVDSGQGGNAAGRPTRRAAKRAKGADGTAVAVQAQAVAAPVVVESMAADAAGAAAPGAAPPPAQRARKARPAATAKGGDDLPPPARQAEVVGAAVTRVLRRRRVAATMADAEADAGVQGAEAAREAAAPRRRKGGTPGGAEAPGVPQKDALAPEALPTRRRTAAAKAAAAVVAAADAATEVAKAATEAPAKASTRQRRGRTVDSATAVAEEEGTAPEKAPTPTPARRRADKGASKAAAGSAAAANRSDPRVTPVLSAAEVEALRDVPLLDLGQLQLGTLVRRPSASIKSPYVADVRLVVDRAAAGAAADDGAAATDAGAADIADSGAAGGELLLAHAPALDCAGMIAPGAILHLSVSAGARKAGAPAPATSHAIQLVVEARPGGSTAIVGCHPALGEKLAAELVLRRALEGALGPYDGFESQRTFGATRVDYVLRMADGSRTLLEVKNVVCADFPEGGVPPGRKREGVYTAPAERYVPTALFPHGSAKPKIKVVSDRAIKHVWELTQLHGTRWREGGGGGGDTADGNGGDSGGAAEGPLLRSAVLFLVNRSDCSAFRPCHEADPLFASVLRAAQEAGVTLLAYDVEWRGGAAFPGRRLPVAFDTSVGADYDGDWLRRVLEYNATDPRKNWKPKKGAATKE